LAERLIRREDRFRKLEDVRRERQPCMGARLEDPLDAPTGKPMEDRVVLDERDLLRGLHDRVEIGALGAAWDEVELHDRQSDRNAHFDEWLHLANANSDIGSRLAREDVEPPRVHRGVLPTERSLEVDNFATRKVKAENARSLVVDELPRFGED